MSDFRIPDYSDINRVFYEIEELTHSANPSYKQNVESRYTTLLKGGSIELLVLAQSIGKAVLQLFGVGISYPLKLIVKIPSFSKLDQYNEKLPTTTALWETTKRVVTVAVGLLNTLTIGVFSPSTNFRIQIALGLVEPKSDQSKTNLDNKCGLSDEDYDLLLFGE